MACSSTLISTDQQAITPRTAPRLNSSTHAFGCQDGASDSSGWTIASATRDGVLLCLPSHHLHKRNAQEVSVDPDCSQIPITSYHILSDSVTRVTRVVGNHFSFGKSRYIRIWSDFLSLDSLKDCPLFIQAKRSVKRWFHRHKAQPRCGGDPEFPYSPAMRSFNADMIPLTSINQHM